MRAAPLLVLPLLVIIAGVREAPAMCMAPVGVTFPLGDQLPPQPILYCFEPSWQQPTTLRIEGPGGPVAFTTRDAGWSKEMRIIEIRVAARSGPITVHAGDTEPPRSFDVGPQPTTPPIEAATVDDLDWVKDSWTCSDSHGLAARSIRPRSTCSSVTRAA